MGPARAFEEREKFGKIIFFLRNAFLSKIAVLDFHMALFYSFHVFFGFLAEICFRTIAKLPQKASSRTQTCSFGASCTLPQATV